MKTNYHTHTYRCGHAMGTEEEMVKEAINQGYTVLGFSDHIPLPHYRLHVLKGFFKAITKKVYLKNFLRNFIYNGYGMRMPYPTIQEHLDAVKEVKEKYKDQITVIQGFEAEYFEEYLDYYKELLSSGKAEYLILGNHFHKHSLKAYYYGRKGKSIEDILQYKEDTIKAIKTGLFSYVAHPDLYLLNYPEFNETCRQVAYEICQCAKEYHIPLELNAGGIRRNIVKMNGKDVYPYANEYFFEIAGECGNDIIFGIDAHTPYDFNEHDEQILVQIAKKCNLHVIQKIEFKKYQK